MDFESYKSKLSKKRRKLLLLVETGTLAQVQNLARQIHKLDCDKIFTYLLLVTALRRKHRSISKFLIKLDCKVMTPLKTNLYNTPLYYAVEMGDMEIFRALRKKGASVFDKDANIDTALEIALRGHKLHMVNFLLSDIERQKKSKDLDPNRENDVALFHAACWSGNYNAVQMFLSRGFSVTSRSVFCADDWKGFTPLHFGLNRAFGMTVNSLLTRRDSDLFAQDARGRTPVHVLFRQGYIYSFINEAMLERMIGSNENRSINPMDEYELSHFHIFCSLKFADKDNEKHMKLIKYFIDRNVDINSSVSSEDEIYPGFTALHFAAEESSWEVLRLLLQNGADPNKTEKEGRTPLHLVCKVMEHNDEKRLETVRLLLLHGADHAAKDSQDCTPLHLAFYKHLNVHPLDKCEEFLLSKNQHGINYTDAKGLSYLHIACAGNDVNRVKILINNGASITSRFPSNSSRFSNYSALHFAVDFNQFEIAKFLLTLGADANCVNDAKNTPLHLACDHTIAKLSQPLKIDEEYNDETNWPPSRSTLILIIELLLEYGATVDAENSTGSTPLLKNCSTPRSLFTEIFTLREKLLVHNELFMRQEKILVILLHHGANIKARCNVDGSVLHILAKNYKECPLNRELAKIALRRGADVNAVDTEKSSPLHLAVKESVKSATDLAMIDLFLQCGANVNAISNCLGTSLHIVIWLTLTCRFVKSRDLFAMLLRQPKIDVNVQDSRGQTPLHIAVHLRDHFYINELLNHGADVNVEDSNGHTPIHSFLKCVVKMHYTLEDAIFRKTLIAFIIHVKRFMKLNLYIGEKVRNEFETLLHHASNEVLVSVDSQIDKEIEFLKLQRLDSYTSFYDILFKDSSAMAKHVLNKNLKEAISSMRSGSDSSIFGGIMKRNFDRGLNRLRLLGPAQSSLAIVTKRNWPDSCSQHILGYLNDGVLEDLIGSTSVVEKREISDINSHAHGEFPTKIRRCNQ